MHNSRLLKTLKNFFFKHTEPKLLNRSVCQNTACLLAYVFIYLFGFVLVILDSLWYVPPGSLMSRTRTWVQRDHMCDLNRCRLPQKLFTEEVWITPSCNSHYYYLTHARWRMRCRRSCQMHYWISFTCVMGLFTICTASKQLDVIHIHWEVAQAWVRETQLNRLIGQGILIMTNQYNATKKQ